MCSGNVCKPIARKSYVCQCLGIIDSRNTRLNGPMMILCTDGGNKGNMCTSFIYKTYVAYPRLWKHNSVVPPVFTMNCGQLYTSTNYLNVTAMCKTFYSWIWYCIALWTFSLFILRWIIHIPCNALPSWWLVFQTHNRLPSRQTSRPSRLCFAFILTSNTNGKCQDLICL